MFFAIRIAIALLIALGLALHGYKKKSLSFSGAISAFLVGFASFAVSYRFGVILILFYYTSSKLTKVKEDVKARLEDGYVIGGQRGAVQVLACSILATVVALFFAYYIGEDCSVDFSSQPSTQLELNNILDFPYLFTSVASYASHTPLSVSRKHLAAYLWSAYIAHYATTTADTWASELGILSKNEPRLITTLFMQEVPRGTNGGVSLFGTLASALGGAFIGCIFWVMSSSTHQSQYSQYPMVSVGLLCGLLGSLIDSLLGATVQATYYDREKRCIVKRGGGHNVHAKGIDHICGMDILSNEAVNVLSTLLTMILSLWLTPLVFCLCDNSHCSA
mmetsp:Transcript_358/g.415  ORF Transcript_358/g.415 Transcript_358/m.415 type:complete len:334 (-) Transcript_358:61-1062(-)